MQLELTYSRKNNICQTTKNKNLLLKNSTTNHRTWAHWGHCGDNREGTLFSWLHIYCAHLAPVRFEHSVYRGSLMTTYIYIYIYICFFKTTQKLEIRKGKERLNHLLFMDDLKLYGSNENEWDFSVLWH